MTRESAVGLWNALSIVERAESPKLAKVLGPFSRPVANCYECGVEVPTLPSKRAQTKDIGVAALFLKRTLNDLRATWNLLLQGYTSQAGSVAAAAFENALIVTCIAGDADRANLLITSKSGESPWSVADLCKMHMRQAQEQAEKCGKSFSEREFDLSWRELYAQYAWLCKIKHPTMPSALHDAFSVSLKEEEYIVMAAPDTRPEDTPNKAMILVATINRILAAIRKFASACEIDLGHSRVISWQKRLDSVIPDIKEAMKPLWSKPLPVSIRNTKLAREYWKLRQTPSDK